MEINILIDEEFEDRLDTGWLRDLAQQALTAQGVGPEAELSLFIASQERVRELNLSYRGKDANTDVLAFHMLPEGKASPDFIAPPDGLNHLGEVIVSYPQAVIQAGEQGHSVDRELATLVVHGILHLLGYDDQSPELKEKMHAREQEILGHSNTNQKGGASMKVLGISGSPRRGGNTDILLAEVLRGAASQGAETKTIILNDLDIIACQHCDYCLKKGECRQKDDMQLVYRELAWAERVVIATPIHFMGPAAQLKTMIDRCQALWARKYVLKIPPLENRVPRKGLFLAVGGMNISGVFEASLAIIKALFTVLDISYEGELLFSGVDEKGAIKKHPEALSQAFQAGQKLIAD